jgi:hypothetical protein
MKYLVLISGLLLLLACGGGAALIRTPAPPVVGKSLWTCPPPPEAGVGLTPVAGEPTVLPVPTATPYRRSDVAFLGQDVYAGAFRITVHAVTDAGPVDAAQGGGVLRLVDLEVASAQALALDLPAQVVIREVVQADGSGARGWWHSDPRAQDAAGALPTQLAPGGSWRGTVAIRTPEGSPSLVYIFRTPDEARMSDTPTDGLLIVRVAHDPFCVGNIARPNWTPGAGGGGIDGTPVVVPPGSNALVAFVVARLGYPYVWGAKGPNAFDCSGLLYAAYASLGISIPAGTRGGPAPGQGYFGTALMPSQLRPGDLLFFQITGDAPSHVGMYVGDLDGDGRGDMIHAATPALGVIFESDVFGSAFWTRVYWGARRMPGFPY